MYRIEKDSSRMEGSSYTPLLKSGDPSDVTNYRPIALLCSISKVLEEVLFTTIISHFLPSISLYQFGFVPGRSCLQQPLTTLLLIYKNSKSHSFTDIVYLDFIQ